MPPRPRRSRCRRCAPRARRPRLRRRRRRVAGAWAGGDRQVARLLDRSLGAAKAGDRERAYALARTAYLDHYEYVEIPLRLRDPNLVLDTEFKFADLRNDLGGARRSTRSAPTCATCARGSSRPTARSPRRASRRRAIAFGFSFSILFREGVEAVLLIAILLGSLAAGRPAATAGRCRSACSPRSARPVVTWLLATLVIDIAPVNRELMEAITALLAVAVLVARELLAGRADRPAAAHGVHARPRGDRDRRRQRDARSPRSASPPSTARASRPSSSTRRCCCSPRGSSCGSCSARVAAVVALGAVAYAILRLGRKLPLKPMLITGASMLLLLSVAFVGNAVRSLQGADMVRATPVHAGWARPPVFVAELTGIHPTQRACSRRRCCWRSSSSARLYMFAWLPRAPPAQRSRSAAAA